MTSMSLEADGKTASQYIFQMLEVEEQQCVAIITFINNSNCSSDAK